jgi:hypothetical protein
MSFATSNMVQMDSTHQAMNVALANPHLPQMLRQSNYLGSGDMRTANVNFRVMPHADAQAPPAPAEPVLRAGRGLPRVGL